MSTDVVVPRLNANEDQNLVVQVAVALGDAVAEGQLLFVLETTKAAGEVLAPCGGILEAISVAVGDMVDVDSVLCRIGPAKVETGANAPSPQQASGDKGVTITMKARLRARELGIDIEQVRPVAGRIGVADVESFAKAAPAPVVVAMAPPGARAIVVGAGGHAVTIADLLARCDYSLVGFTDPNVPVGTSVLGGLKVLGTDDLLPQLLADGVSVAFIGLGGVVDNRPRKRLFLRLAEMGFALPPAVHPHAHVGLDTSIGAATYVLHGATIGPRCQIGDNVIINQGSQVSHDSRIGNHCHLTPGSLIAGNCHIGPETTVGMAATVLLGCRIGANCLIHNNASVTGAVSDDMEVFLGGRRGMRTDARAGRPDSRQQS